VTPEEVWRRKSDEELLAASTRLAEYTDSGQSIIRGEIRRRDLTVTTDSSTDQGESADDTRLGTVPAAVSQGAHAYVARLWRGEVSLPITYWLWGFLGNALTRILIVIVLLATNASVALSIGLAVLYLAYCAFIIVAIWRSAGRYTGRRIWRDLARFSLALLLITWLADRLFWLTD
jgi:hypothetical protein